MSHSRTMPRLGKVAHARILVGVAFLSSIAAFFCLAEAAAAMSREDLLVALKAQAERLVTVKMSGTVTIIDEYSEPNPVEHSLNDKLLLKIDLRRSVRTARADLFIRDNKYRMDISSIAAEYYDAEQKKVTPPSERPRRWADDGARSIDVDPINRVVNITQIEQGIWGNSYRSGLYMYFPRKLLVTWLSAEEGKCVVEVGNVVGESKTIIVKVTEQVSGNQADQMVFYLDTRDLVCTSWEEFLVRPNGQRRLTGKREVRYSQISGMSVPTESETTLYCWKSEDSEKPFLIEKISFKADPESLLVNAPMPDEQFTPLGMGATFDFIFYNAITGEDTFPGQGKEEIMGKIAEGVTLGIRTEDTVLPAVLANTNTASSIPKKPQDRGLAPQNATTPEPMMRYGTKVLLLGCGIAAVLFAIVLHRRRSRKEG